MIKSLLVIILVAVLTRAAPYLPTLNRAFHDTWPEAPMKYIEAGKIEQESAWRIHAENITSREYGFGFSQCTIAFCSSGKIRYNNFETAKKQYVKELKGWIWNDRFNPKYNFTYAILTDKSNFTSIKKLFKNNTERWAGTLVCYNAGNGTVIKRRSMCKVTNGCDDTKWFGGLDSIHYKSEESLLYGKPLWKVRNAYPIGVFQKSEKYKNLI